jgi:hypothetical protein
VRAAVRNALIAIVFLAACPLLLAQQTLNKDSVIKMVKMGFPEDMIVNAINRAPGTYDTSILRFRLHFPHSCQPIRVLSQADIPHGNDLFITTALFEQAANIQSLLWDLVNRFRYYKDDKHFDSADETNWYQGVLTGTRSYLIASLRLMAQELRDKSHLTKDIESLLGVEINTSLDFKDMGIEDLLSPMGKR